MKHTNPRIDVTEFELARRIDHTLLRPEATAADIRRLCDEARAYAFRAVCVNPYYVRLAKELLSGTGVRVCTVVGFPLGASTSDTKTYEAKGALLDGATEVDMVINIGALKSGKYDYVRNEVAAIVNTVKNLGGDLVKAIIECCYLTEAEKIAASILAVQAGADYVKTSTGFGAYGARVEDVQIIRKAVGEKAGVKAAGGIRQLHQALAMLEAGADLLGTSQGVAIIEELRKLRLQWR